MEFTIWLLNSSVLDFREKSMERYFRLAQLVKWGVEYWQGAQMASWAQTWRPPLRCATDLYEQFGLLLPPTSAASVSLNLMDIGNWPNWLLTRLAGMQNGPFPFALAPIGASSPSR